ncbi:MAG: NADH-quinone oxidoreductase subunit A [Cyclobacteriaceae bacterium]
MLEISGFGTVLLFIVGAIGFALIMLLIGRVIRPNNPTTEKQTTYESGEEPSGSAWGKFNVRFYVIALIFLLFEAELVFLFPWAIVFGDEQMIHDSNGLWSLFTLTETFIFISVLVVGLAYVWAKGMLDWVRPKPQKSDFKSVIPLKVYKEFNERH